MKTRASTRSGALFTVAIIGGGFSGAVLAAQLLRRSDAVSAILIERSSRLGRGVAYGTECAQHLLNVRAKNMSAYPDDPEHFLRWAQHHGEMRAEPDDYLPRRLYGQYVTSLLRHEVDQSQGRFTHAQDEAVSVSRNSRGVEIRLRSGRLLFANQLVLALGNFPPADPRLPGKTPHSQRYVSNPWVACVADGAHHDKNILLVGSGLTSVDLAISLRARGFDGVIHILSRRGLLPQSHQATAAHWPPFWNDKSPRTVRGLLTVIREQVRAAEQQGVSWRAVIDALRPFTQEIWRSLPRAEQRRFLRHVRPYWEIHRHRVATEIADKLAGQRAVGQIQIHAGRITKYDEGSDDIVITYRARHTGAPQQLRVERVINCTGPETDCRRIENPLLAALLRQNMIRPDIHFLGLDTSEDGALVNASGEVSDWLYTLGPLRRGSLWETTAVPEIRIQASRLADHLISACQRIDSQTARIVCQPSSPRLPFAPSAMVR